MKKAPEKLRFAAMAIDAVVFGIVDGELCALVSPVNRPPHYVNILGFLGGLVDAKETAEEACDRVLHEKGGLKQVYLEQLYTFSAVNRDKRNRVVSVAYLGLVRPDTAASYAHEGAMFMPVKKLKQLAYDHDDMLQMALKRLQGKLSYTTIAQFLLPRHFTLSELQGAYELILGKEFDKRNFRKKILALDVVKDTGTVQEGVKNRPAALYEFTSKKLQELELIG
ncbi:MAG: NUDIX domain-containing protein [Candidatus Kaiserbacteria bacterium]|nr:NUDIX domain-containing protein [Candidatus Kaiserbacteria bacterium]MCB9816635.1 NUDIX domain-containing protein [Candidatus Nomurabacteria bacterium]